MQRYCRQLGLFIIVGLMGMALACGGGSKKKKGKKTTVSKSDDEDSSSNDQSFDYQVFAPLPDLVTEPTLPMLLDDMGPVEQTCFEPLKLEPQVAGVDTKKVLEENSKEVNRIIRKWVIDDIASTMAPSTADSWEITPINPLAMGVDTDMLKFVEGQECIQNDTGWLGKGVHAVTLMFGAKKFMFETDDPIGVDLQDEMKDAFESEGYVMKSDALELYRPIVDENGEEKTTEEGDLMYRGPGGVSIPENKLPPESERGMKEWTIESEKPLYFAYQELPDDAWTKEGKKKKCDVFLVWGDVTPHAPDCDELKSVTFTAKKADEDTIDVEIVSGDFEKKLNLAMETTERFEIGKRIVLWVNAKKDPDGEGVWIRTNSVVIGSKSAY